jgi:hypothetical protein
LTLLVFRVKLRAPVVIERAAEPGSATETDGR